MDIEKEKNAETEGVKMELNYKDDNGKSNDEIDTSLETKKTSNNTTESDKKSTLIRILTITFTTLFTLLILLVLTFIFDFNHPITLLIPVGCIGAFFYYYIKMKNKNERDIIKSSIDMVLFIITAITASLLIPNTLSNYQINVFDSVMKGNPLGCVAIAYYTMLLIIKAIISRFELRDNIIKYNSKE
ncbi:hypothetical protein [Pectobacterium polaris]|uniref:hypothetical protein n=1 Tax=Pectobacterium polaris TaxID=2042057 RepID=UPI002B245714|nr:hypothetical protein [Pectobacterium polaris]